MTARRTNDGKAFFAVTQAALPSFSAFFAVRRPAGAPHASRGHFLGVGAGEAAKHSRHWFPARSSTNTSTLAVAGLPTRPPTVHSDRKDASFDCLALCGNPRVGALERARGQSRSDLHVLIIETEVPSNKREHGAPVLRINGIISDGILCRDLRQQRM